MKTVFLILVCLLSFGPASAQQGPSVSFGASTLGATLEAGYRIGPNFGMRGIVGFGQANFSSSFNGAPLTGTAIIGGTGLLADIYFGSGARLSAGGIAPRYGADLSITGDITISGTTVNNVDISGSINTNNRFAPLVAVGYEKTFRNNWGISADLGAMYIGGFSLSATDNSGQIPQANLDSELASTTAQLGKISILPFAKISVSFAF